MNDTTVIELVLPKSTYMTLRQAAEQRKKTEVEVVTEAIQAYLAQRAKIDPLLGLFADEPELMDGVTQQAMQDRERTPLRLPEATGG